MVSNLFYDFYTSPVLVLGFKDQYEACIYQILRFVPPWYETGYKSFLNFHIKQVLVLNLLKKIQTWLLMVRGVVASRPCSADMFFKYKNQYQPIYQGAINIPTSLVWTLESIMLLLLTNHDVSFHIIKCIRTIATSEKNTIIAIDNWQDFVEIISYWKEWG